MPPTKARCFSTRSALLRWKHRRDCCSCCRTTIRAPAHAYRQRIERRRPRDRCNASRPATVGRYRSVPRTALCAAECDDDHRATAARARPRRRRTGQLVAAAHLPQTVETRDVVVRYRARGNRSIRLARQRTRAGECTRTRGHSLRRHRDRSRSARDRRNQSAAQIVTVLIAEDTETETSLEGYFVKFVLEHQDALTETELANKLGISRKSLWERRQRLNIPRKRTGTRAPRRDSEH